MRKKKLSFEGSRTPTFNFLNNNTTSREPNGKEEDSMEASLAAT